MKNPLYTSNAMPSNTNIAITIKKPCPNFSPSNLQMGLRTAVPYYASYFILD